MLTFDDIPRKNTVFLTQSGAAANGEDGQPYARRGGGEAMAMIMYKNRYPDPHHQDGHDGFHDGVRIWGITGYSILDLRGGAGGLTARGVEGEGRERQPPPGAGVAKWLNEESEAEAEKEPRHVPSMAGSSTDGMPRVEKRQEDQEVATAAGSIVAAGHVRQIVNLWEALASHRGEDGQAKSNAQGRRGRLPIIRGERMGKTSWICARCAGDFSGGTWEDASPLCPKCAEPGHDESNSMTGNHNTHTHHMDKEEEGSCYEYNFWNIPAYGWTGHDQVDDEEQRSPQREDTSQGEMKMTERCARCGFDLTIPGTTWRICRCGAPACDPCAGSQCGRCGAAQVWSRGGELASGDQAGGSSGPHDPVHQLQAGQQGTDMRGQRQGAVWMSPPQAQVRRMAVIVQKHVKRNLERKAKNALRNEMIRDGRRPRRDQDKQGRVTCVSVNATGAAALIREIRHGTQLRRAGFLFVQEHHLHGEALDRHAAELQALGWHGVIDRAYKKAEGYGGGTAIITADPNGIRPVQKAEEEHIGRLSFGIADLGVDVLMVSVYAISSAPITQQLGIWKHIMMWVRWLGIPFVIAGDMQVAKEDLEKTGICNILDAQVLAPPAPTATVSRKAIDYFVASRALVDQDTRARTMMDCAFRPHFPVVLTVRTTGGKGEVTRLALPRALPIYRPIGPQLPGYAVDWYNWPQLMEAKNGKVPSMEQLDNLTSTWYAAAELELCTIMGVAGCEDEEDYLGIGLPRREVKGPPGGRYRRTDDVLGLLGHRLAWASRGVHLVIISSDELARHGEAVRVANGWPRWRGLARRIGASMTKRAILHPHPDDPALPPPPPHLDTLMRISSRAAAFAAERPPSTRPEDAGATQTLRSAMKMLANVARGVHGELPLLELLFIGEGGGTTEKFKEMHQELQNETKRLLERRKAKVAAEVRRWAARAPLSAAHRATKTKEVSTVHSASADKKHLGCRTPQLAANQGAEEWGGCWGERGGDVADQVLRAVEAIEVLDQDYPDIELPPLDDEAIYQAGMGIRASTATGTDGKRPRHVTLLTRAARATLADILMVIEQVMRWPSVARAVVAAALAKKAGGARLIGISTAIYRIWAKARYRQCRAALEARLKRPFLAAAPNCGAARAAFELAFAAETAVARKEQAATTMVDMAKFYEHIRTEEYYARGRKLGVPAMILSLTTHLYLGPRRLKVRNALSREVFPAWSVLPGCTWATVHVRILIIKPVENFLKKMGLMTDTWRVALTLMIYIDDGIITTIGAMESVATVHARVTRALIEFIKVVLKKGVVREKVQCVATTPALRKRLAAQMNDASLRITATAEALGIDYSAGGPMHSTPAHSKRHAKARKRRGKLRWWRSLQGQHAHQVARGGLAASSAYGNVVHGISHRRMLELRRIQASVGRIRASGASLTARLAVGGDRYHDVDPLIYIASPALQMVLSKIWDEPHTRADYARGWIAARNELSLLPPARAARTARGPIGAAWCFVRGVGVEWNSPFKLKLLDHTVDVLVTPPLQVKRILAAHIRRWLDQALIESIIANENLDGQLVRRVYRHGIDWALVRDMLRGSSSKLSAKERWGLLLTVTGAFWTEDRRWRCGLLGMGSCSGCYLEIGTARHKARDCEAMRADLVMATIAGRHSAPKELDDDPGFAPLVLRGLPPKLSIWKPQEAAMTQGELPRYHDGMYYGDGSRCGGGLMTDGVATWSCLRVARGGITDTFSVSAKVKGQVGGWFPTVPRAEITAYQEFLVAALIPATYAGDCQHVIDVATAGIPLEYTSSRSVNADLWKECRRLREDHGGGGIEHVKVKAHRSYAAAAAEGPEALDHWMGNSAADEEARSLAKSLVDDNGIKMRQRVREEFEECMGRTAFATDWAIRKLPTADGSKSRCKMRMGNANGDASSHELVPLVGRSGWSCARCKLVAATESSLKALRGRPCRGETMQQCHSTHRLQEVNGFLWCIKCGAYTSKVPRALKKECPQRPASEAQANVLRRLRAGLTPTTARYANEVAQTARQVDEDDFWRHARQQGLTAAQAARALLGLETAPRPSQNPVEGSQGEAPSTATRSSSHHQLVHRVALHGLGLQRGQPGPHGVPGGEHVRTEGHDDQLRDDDMPSHDVPHAPARSPRPGERPTLTGTLARHEWDDLHDANDDDDREGEEDHMHARGRDEQRARPTPRSCRVSITNRAQLLAYLKRGNLGYLLEDNGGGNDRARSAPASSAADRRRTTCGSVATDATRMRKVNMANRQRASEVRASTSSSSGPSTNGRRHHEDGGSAVNVGLHTEDGRGLLAQPTLSGESRCSSDLSKAWTRRIVVSAGWQTTPCQRCGSTTAARCKACMRPLCVCCAKRGLRCND